jgi:hypothetical protein
MRYGGWNMTDRHVIFLLQGRDLVLETSMAAQKQSDLPMMYTLFHDVLDIYSFHREVDSFDPNSLASTPT